MKQIASAYTYNKTTGVITLTGVNIDRDQLLLIVNTTRNVTYYNFADSTTTLQAFTQGANTSVTLASSVVSASSTHTNADALTIYYDDQLSSAAFNTSETFGTGVIQIIADAEKDTIRSSLWIPVSSATNGNAGEGQILSQGYPMPAVLNYIDDTLAVQPMVGIDGVLPVKAMGTAIVDDEPTNIQIKVSADGVVQVNQADLGAKADAVATTDTGTFSVIAFIKRGLQNWTSLLAKIPALVSGRIPVDGSGVTQPVSLASVPTHGVTGTFWQTTQPVSLATAPTTPVTGTFWQTTQPISGTVTANTGLTPLTDTQLRATAVSVSTIPSQGTTVASTGFASIVSNQQIFTLASAVAGRKVLTVFNEGTGVLYVSGGGTCTSASYQVRLGAGDYWECPEGQLSLAHTAVFGTTGSAKVVQVT
jgi:hypothetical protein